MSNSRLYEYYSYVRDGLLKGKKKMKTPKTKICTKCGKRKKLEEYYEYKSCVSGVGGACKKCISDKGRKKREQLAMIRKANWKPYCIPLKKRCTKCGKEKKMEEYHKFCRAKDGRKNRCISCIAEDTKFYRLKYPEELRRRKHEYGVKNKVAIAVHAKMFRSENVEKLRERSRIYNVAHSEQNVARAKRWRVNNRDRSNKLSRKNLAIGRMQLSDRYVKDVLVRGTSLCFADIPQVMIETRRELIINRRLLKEKLA